MTSFIQPSISDRDALVLRSPDAVVSALPYLIGFTPHRSVVLLWIAGGRIALTQRIDLPGENDLDAFVAAMWGHDVAPTADELIVLVIPDGLRADHVARVVADSADDRNLEVRDILIVDGNAWRSLLCNDPSCCPDEGRQVRESVRDRVAAEFAVMGVAPLASREDLEREMVGDQRRQEVLVVPIEAAVRAAGARDREEWRDEATERVTALLASRDAVDDPGVVDVLVGLADVRVRDTILWECARLDPDALRHAHARLALCARCAPDPLLAPVATCTAVLAWLLGDGARASIAVDRALHVDPDYSLAVLVMTALRSGLPPTAWREAMAALTREDCRVPRHAA